MKKITTSELLANYVVGLEDSVLARRLMRLCDEAMLLKIANPVPIAVQPKPNFCEIFGNKYFAECGKSLVSITNVSLQRNYLLVKYVATKQRWFPTQLAAEQAQSARDSYAGKSEMTDGYTIPAYIEYADSARVDWDDFADCLEIEYL